MPIEVKFYWLSSHLRNQIIKFADDSSVAELTLLHVCGSGFRNTSLTSCAAGVRQVHLYRSLDIWDHLKNVREGTKEQKQYTVHPKGLKVQKKQNMRKNNFHLLS